MLALLVGVAAVIARVRDLLAVAMLLGVYGLLSACLFVFMDAVDVAFTEASVGAGISTILMLTAVAITGRRESSSLYRSSIALVLVVLTGGLLIYGTLDMPYFGAIDAPANLHVSPRYLVDSLREIDVPNAVTAVLASYRGYDTFGEVVVIFTAGIGVLALLSITREPKDSDEEVDALNEAMHDKHLIVRVVSKMMIPFILLFALYVQFHGDFGPGGGFQAGVIFAAAIILYSLLFGLSTARRVINKPVVRVLSGVGVLLYGGVGVISLLRGENYLDYNALRENPIDGQHLGILLVEFGVGVTVASVMMIIFFNFAGRREHLLLNKDRRE